VVQDGEALRAGQQEPVLGAYGGRHHVDDVGFTARNCPDNKCYSAWAGHDSNKVFHTDEEEQLEKMRRTMGAEDWCKLVGAPVVKKRVASMYVQFSPDPATDTKAEAYRTATDKLGAKTIKTGDKVMTRYLGQWCHGTVSAIYTDDTLTVKYDDGDSWRGAPKYVFYPDEKPALDTAQKEMNAGDWCKLVGAACFAKLLGPAWITYEVTRFVHDYATHD